MGRSRDSSKADSHSVAKVQLQLRSNAERVGDLRVHARGVRGRQLALVGLVAAARVQVAPLPHRAQARLRGTWHINPNFPL